MCGTTEWRFQSLAAQPAQHQSSETSASQRRRVQDEASKGLAAMFSIVLDEYRIICSPNGLPSLYDVYLSHATLVEEIGLKGAVEDGDGVCFLAVTKGGNGWPSLVVAQRYNPCGAGFEPGAILAPETGLLLIGAGERVLGYDLNTPRRLFEDTAESGFWGWTRHGETIVMMAELEMAAWDTRGRKLWSLPVEPPWTYDVQNGIVLLDIMGKATTFPLSSGPDGPASGILEGE